MKTQLFLPFLVLLTLSAGSGALAQCDLSELTVVQKSTSSAEGNCTIDVTVSFTIDKNPGNKYTYVHLWSSAEYPALGYKKAPNKSDLGNVLATLAIYTDGAAKLLQNYGPDNTVPTLYSGVSLNEEVLGDKLYKITISNIKIQYPGNCDEVTAIKGDVWSTQSEADKNPPVHCVSTTLPVHLVRFKGELLDHAIGLSWTTTAEQGSSHFEVERSKDLAEFTTVGRVEASGTTSIKQHYAFVDKLPEQGANYYRLKTTDLDGTSELSRIIYVENSPGNVVFQLLGNPVNGSEIKVIVKNVDLKTLALYDLGGKKWDYRIDKSGITATLKPASNLQPGIYLLRLNDNVAMTRKVLVLPE